MKVGALLGGGFRVIAGHPKELLIWAVIQILLFAAIFAAIMPYLASMLESQRLAAETGAPPSIPAGFGMIMLIYLVALVWLLMLFTAVVRMAGNGGSDSFAWLRLGMDELRLVGLGILYLVAWMIGWIVVALIGGLLIAAFTAVNTSLGFIFTAIFVIACLCAGIWVGVRTSLIAPVMVLEREFAIRRGWRATRGHFWTLFLAFLVMFGGYILLEIVVIAIMSPAIFSGMLGSRDPQQVIEAQQQMMASFTSPSPILIIVWVIGTVIGTAAMAYYYGVLATAAIAATGHSTQDLAELESSFE